jgi:RNA polymerase sigma factor (sigma-70 family)
MERNPCLDEHDLSFIYGWSDETLLTWLAITHNKGLFGVLVKRHERMVRNVCRRVLHHWQDAEDASQRTFDVFWRKADELYCLASLKSWLCGVAYRVARDVLKSRKRREKHESTIEICALKRLAQFVDEADSQELQALLDVELRRLPEKFRVPFVLSRLAGRSRAEVARELGCKEGTVASRIRKAREFLQRRLTRSGIMGPS